MFKFFFISILFLTSCFSNILEAKKTELKPFVTCWLNGQLGNQLHQIATTLAYARDNNFIPFFPELNKTDFNIPMNKDRIFFRLNASSLPRSIKHVFTSHSNFGKRSIPKFPDLMLKGYFQNWEYYHHHRDELLQIFAPGQEELDQIQSKHKTLLNHPVTVGVHVRTFNKKYSEYIPFVGMDYYEKAMSLFPEETLFVIFSDRINWCKHHFQKIDRPMIFIEGQDHIQDFFLMSMLKHNIIGNSSYSWWAAYLNQNPDKTVVAPSHFIIPITIKKKCNSLLPDWIELPIDLEAPYPTDIKDYDEFSQSIDTQ